MSRVQLALNVDDIDEAIAFYSKLYNTAPAKVKPGYANFAITGQFCEQPDDVVFTVEYSIRPAMTAAYELPGLDRKPPAVFKGQLDPRNLYRAFRALHDLNG